ncbi:uncharacterized protein LOC120666985 [Panicum virgatum]|uniref:Uncharacterized protein n=1 Tax=Panicum virgatum TaxID=38727 RepID=A0A8T0UN82_PANVG|nr:uncharacterized protein LOC120666985 [Panicum virgatum]KAG2622243.1 hypothetical protein PVAP13_3NG327875 [Panicum virgatum]
MAAATSYATHAMASPAGQWAILALLSLSVSLTALPAGTGFSENPKLICCKIYISESRNKSALDEIDKAARKDPENVVVLIKQVPRSYLQPCALYVCLIYFHIRVELFQ